MNQTDLRNLADRICTLPMTDVLFLMMNIAYGASKMKAPEFVTKQMQDVCLLMQRLDYQLSKSSTEPK